MRYVHCHATYCIFETDNETVHSRCTWNNYKGHSRSSAMPCFIGLPGLSIRYQKGTTGYTYFQTKIAQMTLKVDQSHWWWHNSIGHVCFFLLVVCNREYHSWPWKSMLGVSRPVNLCMSCTSLKCTDPVLFQPLTLWVYLHSILHSKYWEEAILGK